MKSWLYNPIDSHMFNRFASAFENHGSDKCRYHNYQRVYGYYLPHQISALLEIGLAVDVRFNSMLPWSKLYPEAKIYGGDRHADRMTEGPNIKTFLVDQESQESLNQFKTKIENVWFDVIIDDASHVFPETKRTFDTLFPLLKKDGLYFIEDVCWRPNPKWDQQRVLQIEEWLAPMNHEIINARPESPEAIGSVIAVIRK